MSDLCMLSYEYSNSAVEFRVSIPFKGDPEDEDNTLLAGLYYLEEEFGLDRFACQDSWVEWE